MAQAGWFLYQRWDGAAIGVFSSENNAKQATVDGEYVIVPIEANQSYTSIDESLPGAIVFQADGFQTRLTALENQADAIQAELDNTQSQAQAKFAHVDGRLDDLESRIAILEGG